MERAQQLPLQVAPKHVACSTVSCVANGMKFVAGGVSGLGGERGRGRVGLGLVLKAGSLIACFLFGLSTRSSFGRRLPLTAFPGIFARFCSRFRPHSESGDGLRCIDPWP